MRRLLVLVAVLVMIVPGVALAQTPTADEEDGVFTTLRKEAGLDIRGEETVGYEQAGLDLGAPLYFLFWATEFEDEKDASEMMDLVRSDFIDTYIERFEPDFPEGIELVETSGVDLGDDDLTLSGSRTAEGFTAYDGVVFVRVGSVIVVASGGALIGNMVTTLTPFIEQMVDAAKAGDDLLDIVPTLDNLPPGYVVSDQV